MMQKRISSAAIIVLLLAPATLQSFAWTPINLFFDVVVIVLFICVARYMPVLKWPGALSAAIAFAVPPYPNWVWASNERGWHFHVGYKIEHFPEFACQFGLFFVVALMLFLMLFKIVVTHSSR